jgi:hypothetical protein
MVFLDKTQLPMMFLEHTEETDWVACEFLDNRFLERILSCIVSSPGAADYVGFICKAASDSTGAMQAILNIHRMPTDSILESLSNKHMI